MNKKSNSNPKKNTFGKDFKKDKKSSDFSNKPSKKTYGSSNPNRGEGSSLEREGKPYRKPFDKSEGYKKDGSSSGSSKFGQKSYGKDDRPFKKSFDGEDKPYRKPFDKSSGYKKDGNSSGSSKFGQKSYGKDDRPFKKSFDREDKPYRKPFDKSEGYKKEGKFSSGNKFAKKPFNKEERPFKKWDKEKGEEKRFENSGERGERGERKFTSKKKKSFGKFEEEDLSFGKRKIAPERKPREEKEEISFSKNLDKWEVEEVKINYGKAEEKFDSGNRVKAPQRGDFKRHFSDENPHEKVYSSDHDSIRHRKTDNYFSEDNLGGEMPLNKYIAHCGICSRRDAVKIIKEGKVKVNGVLIDEPGHKVSLSDLITLSGKKLLVQKNLVYILLNKAKGFITTTDDPKGRRTVMDIFKDHIDERVFPVGRLDRNTTGLLIITNDGELTQKLSHPKYEVRKIYQVTLDKDLTLEHFDQIVKGLMLEDGPVHVDQMEFLDSKMEVGLQIHSGRNRIVRRIFESLGYEVEKLDRVMYANLTKKNLPRGKWRFLSKQEIINLKHLNK